MNSENEVQTGYLIIWEDWERRLHSREKAMELVKRERDKRTNAGKPMRQYAVARISWRWGKEDP